MWFQYYHFRWILEIKLLGSKLLFSRKRNWINCLLSIGVRYKFLIAQKTIAFKNRSNNFVYQKAFLNWLCQYLLFSIVIPFLNTFSTDLKVWVSPHCLYRDWLTLNKHTIFYADIYLNQIFVWKMSEINKIELTSSNFIHVPLVNLGHR